MRSFLLFTSWVLLAGCPDTAPTRTGGEPVICDLATQEAVCPECFDGNVTCTFEDTSVTEASCGGCQAEASIYTELCALDPSISQADLDAELECN